MNIVWNLLSAMASIIIVAALVPFGAVVMTLCAGVTILGIIAGAMTGRRCLHYTYTRSRVETVNGNKRKTRVVTTTNRNGKTKTEVVES